MVAAMFSSIENKSVPPRVPVYSAPYKADAVSSRVSIVPVKVSLFVFSQHFHFPLAMMS